MSAKSWLSTRSLLTVSSNRLSIILLSLLKNCGCAFFNSDATATMPLNFSGTIRGLTKSSVSELTPVYACVSVTPVSACTCSLSLCFSAGAVPTFLSIAAYLPATSFCRSITVCAISLPPVLASSTLSIFLPTSPVEIVLPVLSSNSSINCCAVALLAFAALAARSRLVFSSVASASSILAICASVPPTFREVLRMALATFVVP